MSGYYAGARTEIFPYLPKQPKRLLELGCSAGGTIAAIKELHPTLWAAGVELHKESAQTAQKHADMIWQGTVEETPWAHEIAAGSLDAILCLDILEHLVDPWKVVKQLSLLLAPGGQLIISIPNIRNWKFIAKLFFKGDFNYRDAGLLDRTHLRFFTRQSAIELAICGGLKCDKAVRAHDWRVSDARYILSSISGGGLDEILAKQWIIVAVRA